MANRPLVLALALLAFAAVACGDGDSAAEPTSAPTIVEQPTQSDVARAGDPGLTVRTAIQACREKDAALLQSFVDGAVETGAVEAMFAGGSDVQLLSQTVPEPEGATASITVRLRIRHDGETEDVERTWDLARGEDGLWRFTELPNCF